MEVAGDLGKVTGEAGELGEETGELSEGGVEVSGWRSAPKNTMKDVGGSKAGWLEDGAAADSSEGEAK